MKKRQRADGNGRGGPMCPPVREGRHAGRPLHGSFNSCGFETVTRRFENEPNSNPEAGEDIDERISAK